MGTGGVNLKFEGSIMVDLIILPLNFEYHVWWLTKIWC
jgi:hypothetical protein